MKCDSSALREQSEIFVPAQTSGSEIVLNDKDGDLAIGRNHHWPKRSFPAVDAVTAFLIFKNESGEEKHALQRLPIHWHQTGPRWLRSDGEFTTLHRNPSRAVPRTVSRVLVARFHENLIERSRICATGHKTAHRLVRSLPRCFRVWSRTRHIQWHRMRHELRALFPNLNGVIDLHLEHLSTSVPMKKAASARIRRATL